MAGVFDNQKPRPSHWRPYHDYRAQHAVASSPRAPTPLRAQPTSSPKWGQNVTMGQRQQLDEISRRNPIPKPSKALTRKHPEPTRVSKRN
jgi:hypothetical protein